MFSLLQNRQPFDNHDTLEMKMKTSPPQLIASALIVATAALSAPCLAEDLEFEDSMRMIREAVENTPTAKAYLAKLEECRERITSTSPTETCEDEFLDYTNYVDTQVNKQMFSRLK